MAWKLVRKGQRGQGPVIPPPEDGGDPADLAELPVARAPNAHPNFPDGVIAEELDHAEYERGHVRPERRAAIEIPGIDHPEGADAPLAASIEVPKDGVEPVDPGSGPEEDDDFPLDRMQELNVHVPEDLAAQHLGSPPVLGSIREEGAPIRSARIASTQVDAYTLRAFNTSLRKVLREKKKGGREAVMAELKQMIDKRVWAYMHAANLSITQLKKIIRCHLFVKEKLDAAGVFQKIKARLVAGGDGQDKSIYQTISSPTVCLESVFGMLAVAAILRRKIATVDITGAYLECELPEEDEVLMKLGPLLSALVVEIDPTAVPFRDDKGCLVVKLKRALYGCVQSARLWFEKLRDTLLALGFESNPYDLCTFHKTVDDETISIAFHVDDLLITCRSDAIIDNLVSDLEKTFANVSSTRGAKHSYLGMRFVVTDEAIELDMSGYLKKILSDSDSLKLKPTPADANLMTDDSSSILLDAEGQKVFHSQVAKILFVAKRCRMMCLPAISVLASKVYKATEQDRGRLDRIFHYLNATKDMVMKFKCGGKVSFEAYVDASWAVHDDCHGRTGLVLMMAGCAIGAWSYKQKMVTRSSTESEIVALSDALSEIIWFRKWLTAQGFELPPTPIHEDNEAVIKLMREERRTHQRTKHLDARYFYARDLELSGEIMITWSPTTEMIADLMTKPLQGHLFLYLTSRLTGNYIPKDSINNNV